jgi:dipeptidyl-peptidase-4
MTLGTLALVAAGGSALAAAAAAAAPAQPTAASALSLERVFSDPRLEGVPPSAPAWSPQGARLAYLWSDAGRRASDLWLYDPAAAAPPRKLTDIQILATPTGAVDEATAQRREARRLVDEGVDSFVWSPDGRSILFTLQEDLFLVSVDGGSPRRLTRTASPEFDPQFSPDGARIAFVRDSNLWTIQIADGSTTQVTTDGSETLLNGLSDYISLEELSRLSAYEWSADGKRLIYLQADTSPVRVLEIPDYLGKYVTHHDQRRPPAGEANSITRVGVVGADGGETRWVPLKEGVSDFYVPKLKRLGDRVALLQEDRGLKKAWLFFIDPATATARQVLEEKDDAWINLDKIFLGIDEPSGLLVYGSERGGFGHLYGLDGATGNLTPLTSGSWEVAALDRVAGGKIYFTANADGPAERHFYRAPLGGGAPEKLTAPAGWHEGKVSADGAWMADVFSDVDRPNDLYVSRTGSKDAPQRLTSSPSKEFASLPFPKIEFLTIKSRADGQPIAVTLMHPASDAPKDKLSRGGKHPAIVRVHGAGYTQSIKRAWGGYSFLIHTLLARQGYYVLDVDYRGSSGYGRKWRTDVYLALGGLDLQDSITGAEYLRSLPGVDPKRVAIWGWSYGGFLTNMAMLATPGAFDAGVAVAPVNDWAGYDTEYTEERLGTPQAQPEAYKKSSPITYADGLKGPLLMIHGLRDDNVHAQDTVRLVDALVKAGKDFDLMVYPEGKHGITRDASRIHLFKKMFVFLDEKMAPPGPGKLKFELGGGPKRPEMPI